MALFKGSIFFEAGKFGWSETYGVDKGNSADAKIAFLDLLPSRKDLLGQDAAITWLRTYSADPAEPFSDLQSISSKNGTTSIAHPAVDRPYSALLVTIFFTDLTRGRIFMRGIPDEFVKHSSGNQNTGFEPSGAWTAAFEDFAGQLAELAIRRVYVKRLNPGEDPPQYDLTSRLIGDLEWKKAVSRNTGRPIELPRGRRFTHRNA